MTKTTVFMLTVAFIKRNQCHSLGVRFLSLAGLKNLYIKMAHLPNLLSCSVKIWIWFVAYK